MIGFWYTCAPNDVASELFSCPSTAFREAEVSIDGRAGCEFRRSIPGFTLAASILIWASNSGVHTLNFEPYRVDLTPLPEC